MRIANGYGGLKGRTFRIAHMGDTQMRDIQKLLQALDDYTDNRAAWYSLNQGMYPDDR
jgi:aspartate aminotransferase-like enzyme